MAVFLLTSNHRKNDCLSLSTIKQNKSTEVLQKLKTPNQIKYISNKKNAKF